MKMLSLALAGIILFVYMIFSVIFPAQANMHLILGGSHTIEKGQQINGNLIVLFADVIIEPGGNFDNKGIFAFSSDMDIYDSIDANILALESDIDVHAPASLAGKCITVDLLNIVLLLPKIYVT